MQLARPVIQATACQQGLKVLQVTQIQHIGGHHVLMDGVRSIMYRRDQPRHGAQQCIMTTAMLRLQ